MYEIPAQIAHNWGILMPKPKFARLLAMAGVAALLPLASASNAHADSVVMTYLIYNVRTGKCVDLPSFGWNPVDTPVTQYTCAAGGGDNQMWFSHETRTVDGDPLYQLVNSASGLCLDLPSYGAAPAGSRVATYTCNSSPENDNQEWILDEVGPGSYLIVNYKNKLCLDVSGDAYNGGDLANDLPLTVYYCQNLNNDYDDHIWAFPLS